MKMNPWYIKSEIYEPAWDSHAQKLVWSESSATVLYLPDSIKSISQAQELLQRSHYREIGFPDCPWNICAW